MPSREMTLEEWVRRLPPVHRARQEYEALRAAHQEREPDTPQGAWMREYERLMRRLQSVMAGGSILNPLIDDARADIDAHVRGLVEENERLRAHRQRGESDGVL